MKKIILLPFLLLFLVGCESGGSAEKSVDPDFLHQSAPQETGIEDALEEKNDNGENLAEEEDGSLESPDTVITPKSDENPEELATEIPGGSTEEKTSTVVTKKPQIAKEKEQEIEPDPEVIAEKLKEKFQKEQGPLEREEVKVERKNEKKEEKESSTESTNENVEVDEKYSAILVLEAQKYEEQGETKKALAFLERALLADPNNVFAKNKKENLTKQESEKEAKFCESRDLYVDNFFDGITLENRIPERVFQGEAITLRGKITNKNLNRATAFMRSKEDEEIFVAFADEEGNFEMPIFFPENEESVDFFIVPGLSGRANVATIDIEKPCFENQEQDENILAPKNLTGKAQDGRAVFSWNEGEMHFFRLIFSQGTNIQTFFVVNDKSIAPDPSFFRNFGGGTTTLRVAGKKNANDPWSAEAILNFEAGKTISRDQNQIVAHTPDSFSVGKEIVISGVTQKKLSPEMLIASPSEVFYRVPLTLSGDSFSASFVPEEEGLYEIEINQEDQIALFVASISPEKEIPLLPDFFGVRKEAEAVPSDLQGKTLHDLVNAERTAREQEVVKEEESLSQLAQFRADDMCTRGYFGHQDPDQKYASDYKSNFEIKRSIGENIAKDMNVFSAHAGLMRSLGHRELIISPDFSDVGFGFCRSEEQLIVVEIFGKDPISEDSVQAAKKEIWKNIQNTRKSESSGKTITRTLPEIDTDLEEVAQKIADEMAISRSMQTEKDNDLNAEIQKIIPRKSILTLRMIISDLPDFVEAAGEEEILMGGESFKNILLNTRVDSGAIGMATDGESVFVIFIAY